MLNSRERSRPDENMDRAAIPEGAEIRADSVEILENPRPLSHDSNGPGSTNRQPAELTEHRRPPVSTHEALYRCVPPGI